MVWEREDKRKDKETITKALKEGQRTFTVKGKSEGWVGGCWKAGVEDERERERFTNNTTTTTHIYKGDREKKKIMPHEEQER